MVYVRQVFRSDCFTTSSMCDVDGFWISFGYKCVDTMVGTSATHCRITKRNSNGTDNSDARCCSDGTRAIDVNREGGSSTNPLRPRLTDGGTALKSESCFHENICHTFHILAMGLFIGVKRAHFLNFGSVHVTRYRDPLARTLGKKCLHAR